MRKKITKVLNIKFCLIYFLFMNQSLFDTFCFEFFFILKVTLRTEISGH